MCEKKWEYKIDPVQNVSYELNQRRSGRTHRMMKEVVECAKRGELVAVLFSSHQEAKHWEMWLADVCAEAANVTFVTPNRRGDDVRGKAFNQSFRDHHVPTVPESLYRDWYTTWVRIEERTSSMWRTTKFHEQEAEALKQALIVQGAWLLPDGVDIELQSPAYAKKIEGTLSFENPKPTPAAVKERVCSVCSKTCDVGVACWWCGNV